MLWAVAGGGQGGVQAAGGECVLESFMLFRKSYSAWFGVLDFGMVEVEEASGQGLGEPSAGCRCCTQSGVVAPVCASAFRRAD